MWIYTSKGMLSVVADKNNKDRLLVRSRDVRTMLHFIVDSEVPGKHFIDEEADYPFRIFVERKLVEDFMIKSIKNIDYHNFKSSIDENMEEYRTACMHCWSVMLNTQHKQYSWLIEKQMKGLFRKSRRKTNKYIFRGDE